MGTRVEKQGDRMIVAIPPEMAEQVRIHADSPIELRVRSGAIVIQPIDDDDPTLEELVSRITEENRHEEVDWGPPRGREVW